MQGSDVGRGGRVVAASLAGVWLAAGAAAIVIGLWLRPAVLPVILGLMAAAYGWVWARVAMTESASPGRGGERRRRLTGRSRGAPRRKGGIPMSAPETRRWSKRVTERSNALDLEGGVFSRTDPRSIARSLKRSAERSRRRKADPYRSAMSMLTFYINRAGKQLSKRRRARLEAAKDELRALYGRPARPSRRTKRPPRR